MTTQYRADQKTCYLKNAIASPVRNTKANSAVCRTCINGQVIPGTKCVQECGIERLGDNFDIISMKGPDSLRRCAEACTRRVICHSAQYRSGEQKCYLKKVSKGTKKNSKVNSAVCRTLKKAEQS
jgi:hypothetical protein